MMPYNSLAMLAVFAFGLLWLLGIFLTSNVENIQVLAMYSFAIGFFFFFARYLTATEEKLTRTLLSPDHLSIGRLDRHRLPNQVRDLDPPLHHCTWKCHRDFDRNECIYLCGDNCVHPNCKNCRRPDLFPPPASFPSTSASASLPFQNLPPSTYIDTYADDILLRRCRTQTSLSNRHRVDGSHQAFVILCLDLEGYVTELQGDSQNCRPTLNRHDRRRVHEDDRPGPVPPRPLQRRSFSTGSPCFAFLTAMGSTPLGIRTQEQDCREGETTVVSDLEEGEPVRVPPPETTMISFTVHNVLPITSQSLPTSLATTSTFLKVVLLFIFRSNIPI